MQYPAIYSDLFGSREDVESSFDITLPDHIQILLAHYSYEDYSGWARVVYWDMIEKQLYEVHGSHCSCYGLEGQWEPEKCSIQDIIHDLDQTRVYEELEFIKANQFQATLATMQKEEQDDDFDGPIELHN